MTSEDLARRFEYSPPDEARIQRHKQVRQACQSAAIVVTANCRPGREQALALTKLEEAMFWANAAIAREE